MSAIQQVLNAKNYFERLQLPVQTTTQDVLKKHYKKIALQIHPDKCKDEKATEAFKLLTAAFEFLSDSTKQSNHIYEITRQRPPQPKKRKVSEEEFAEQVRRNKPKPKTPKEEPQKPKPQHPKKSKAYHTFGFSYKEESSNSTNHQQSGTSVSCSFCKRTFPTQNMLDRHIMFSDYNHKHPTFKQQQTSKTTEDPVTNIFDL